MQPARPQWWRTSPRTSSALRPTRSRRRVRRAPNATTAPASSSADGSANSYRIRSVNSFSTTSDCAATSAGRSSTADRLTACSNGLPNALDAPRNVSPIVSASEAIQLAGVLAHDLRSRRFAQRRHLGLDGLQRARVRARGVREVGLEENAVFSDRLDEVGELVAVVLEPERGVHVAGEVLRGRLAQLVELLGRVLGHLVLERF